MIRILFSLFLFISSSLTYGESLEINKVVVRCEDQSACFSYKDIFKTLKRNFEGLGHLHDVMKFYVAAEGFERFSYEVKEDKGKNILILDVKRKPSVLGVECSFRGGYALDLPSVLPIKVDDFLDKEKLRNTKELLLEIAENKGFPSASIDLKKKRTKKGVFLNFRIDLKKPIVISDIIITTESNFLKSLLDKKILQYKKRPFDLQLIKNELEGMRQIFLQYGHYLVEFEVRYKYVSKRRVELLVNLKNERSYTFYPKGNFFFSTKYLKEFLSSSLISSKREMAPESIIQVLKEKYQSKGFLAPRVSVEMSKILDFRKEKAVHYNILIEEDEQSKVSDIIFKGNNYLSRDQIIELYDLAGSELANYGVYDEAYLEQFVELLREKYISEGFVNVLIEKPVIQKSKNDVQVVFRIREGIRAYVSKLNIQGVSVELKKKLQNLLITKPQDKFNPLVFKEDLGRIKSFLQNNGYYYAEIKNLNSKELVIYTEENSLVDINLKISTGIKMKIGEVVIIGNRKTRSLLINRKTNFKKGALLKRSEIARAQTKLLGLGIFSSVQIQPISENSHITDLLIFVREKDFGAIELAPGVRTDLGFKLSTLISYNNIDGMNKKIVFKGSVNRRFDLSSFHEDRQDDSKELTEFDLDISFSEKNIFHSEYDFEAVISKSRKRLYSFDADIQQAAYTVSRDFTSWFNVSVKQQLETISQFEAVDSQNHGHFQIGSMTPSVTFDFRDNHINPTSGSFFNLSVEFANPTFLSQSNDELTVNYYKMINRNRFYIPMSTKGVLAISSAVGIQENKAGSDDYIPSIKVFRLSGPDIVRGFEDDEINRLLSGEDISEVEVNKRAYMANIKIEPRFYITDSSMLGVFYDAGRIFVDEFESGSLRSSVGLSFKYLTPVGSLDFDYGIKLLRKKDSDGILDSPGRLHVSIGFF